MSSPPSKSRWSRIGRGALERRPTPYPEYPSVTNLMPVEPPEAIPVGPSPLAQELEFTIAETESPQDYTPPPLLDSQTPDLGADESGVTSVVVHSSDNGMMTGEEPMTTTTESVTTIDAMGPHEGPPTREATGVTHSALINIISSTQENSSSAIGFCIPSIEVSTEEEAWAHAGARIKDGALNVQTPMENLAVDPTIPKMTVPYAIDSGIPHSHNSEQDPEAYSESSENENNMITGTPLPAFHEVISKSNDDLTFAEGARSTGSFWGQFETDGDPSQPSQSGLLDNTADLPPAVNNILPSRTLAQNFLLPQPSTDKLKLQNFGWIEYQLPDRRVYYVRPTYRVITDIDLRVDEKLDTITDYLIQYSQEIDPIPTGMELWLREPKSTKRSHKSAQLAKYWVDHKNRTVAIDPHENYGSRAKGMIVDDDQLDKEYRYWTFMETHPAHASLPADTKTEVMDILTWAWTDLLLPSNRTAPAPFTKEECQELLSLLRSFSGGLINSPLLWAV